MGCFDRVMVFDVFNSQQNCVVDVEKNPFSLVVGGLTNRFLCVQSMKTKRERENVQEFDEQTTKVSEYIQRFFPCYSNKKGNT